MSHTTRLAFLGKGASFLAIFLVQLLVVYLVVTVTGNRRPSIYIYYIDKGINIHMLYTTFIENNI